ncbi:Uncharacterized protein BCZB5J_00355 [Bacillus cereus]|uniref:Transport permease protein n=1 Tax=Bacillus wiedmannii TaxID=1890302 RepID=A0A2B5P394_9BACI|nr:hypothetical protein [Bacillus wiedmannii]KMP77629.1 hypothetical protein TU62_04145 [Bacillus cereus]MBG9855630.1 hypothetical protein [Bacillus wiedmannii]MCQ6544439.1 hypothetical protein [Bacillus wiedmannii]MCQ6573879.1 hypothetical protein [Bacillus wiedmannii]MCU5574609.1 hypothetical protein [Bacillus wiedmannii]
MRRIFGFTILNIKILFSEKIALVWTVVLPVFIALIVQKNVLDSITTQADLINYLSLFWVFIIVSSYINGIGLQLARLREYGLLKTYSLIAGNKNIIIFATFLTQILFCFISLMLFNFIMCIIYNIQDFSFFLIPILLLLLGLPIGLVSLAFATVPFRESSISTIVNILTYPLFIVSLNSIKSIPDYIQILNPFKLMKDWNMFFIQISHGNLSVNFIMQGLFVLIIYSLVGLICLRKVNLLSQIQR